MSNACVPDAGDIIGSVANECNEAAWIEDGRQAFETFFVYDHHASQSQVRLFYYMDVVFTVLLIEFRSFYGPIAIVFGSVLALFGALAALWITGVSLNIVSFLGMIIGVGIVAKNGILVLDYFQQLRAQGVETIEALVRAGHRRLRPVLMTSLAAALGMLPLAYGVGTSAQMLQPLGIAVIGALFISVLLSLIATPVVYYLLMRAHLQFVGENHPPF